MSVKRPDARAASSEPAAGIEYNSPSPLLRVCTFPRYRLEEISSSCSMRNSRSGFFSQIARNNGEYDSFGNPDNKCWTNSPMSILPRGLLAPAPRNNSRGDSTISFVTMIAIDLSETRSKQSTLWRAKYPRCPTRHPGNCPASFCTGSESGPSQSGCRAVVSK